MTTVRHRWRRNTGVVAATGMAALVGTGILATPASAHTPNWHVTCSTVSVDLEAYRGNDNTVTIKADGKDLLRTTTFGSSFQKELNLADHDSPVKLELIVKAGDD